MDLLVEGDDVVAATLFILFNVAPQIVFLHGTRNDTKSNFVFKCSMY